MRDIQENNGQDEKQATKISDKKIDTFDDLRTQDKPKGIETFDDIRKQGSESSIKTFDDLQEKKGINDKSSKSKETAVGGDRSAIQSEKTYLENNKKTEISFNGGRHRTYVALKEGYNDVPIKLNDVIKQNDKFISKDRGIQHAAFDKSILESNDMKMLQQEHDFQKWERGEVAHKGLFYKDYVDEFKRLGKAQDVIKQGGSPEDIDKLGQEYKNTYKRFYETNPIKVDRVLESDNL
jgi:hypothetical protein